MDSRLNQSGDSFAALVRCRRRNSPQAAGSNTELSSALQNPDGNPVCYPVRQIANWSSLASGGYIRIRRWLGNAETGALFSRLNKTHICLGNGLWMATATHCIERLES